ncbi:hypothetical protein [Acetobacter senegalensis]|uniref:hypothetical protein n=1 Tax=Acetobacter senegalensis TaxID=446692 RepID=UPI0026543299|nr:hypothetical protein [Acetobacter senegalensis]MDN7355041.1 hypothetical protein [Acetobacter senegalensis]
MFCLCRICLFQICLLHSLTILSAGIGAVIALDLFGLPFSGMAAVAMLLTGIFLLCEDVFAMLRLGKADVCLIGACRGEREWLPGLAYGWGT